LKIESSGGATGGLSPPEKCSSPPENIF